MDHATLSLPTYPALYARVHRAVTSYRAQRDQEALITPLPSEKPQDWERLLDELSHVDYLTVTRQRDGTVHLAWYRKQAAGF